VRTKYFDMENFIGSFHEYFYATLVTRHMNVRKIKSKLKRIVIFVGYFIIAINKIRLPHSYNKIFKQMKI